MYMGASENSTETSLKMNPTSLAYTHFRARFFESRLDISKAIANFEQSLEFETLQQNPKDLSSVLYHLALLNFLAGNDREAIEFARLCLETSPGHKIAEAIMGWCNTVQSIESFSAYNTRSQILLERFSDESIPIIQALKNNRIIEPHSNEDINLKTTASTPSQSSWAENDQRLTNLQNIHKGKRAFILGNGPSLSIADLNKLKNEITFASNKIYLAFEKTDIRMRDIPKIKIECIWINIYHGGKWSAPSDDHLFIDNVVVATRYIGPMAKPSWSRAVK